MVFVPVAGIAAAALAAKGRRAFDLSAWGAALVTCAAVLGTHAYLARQIVTPTQGLDKWLGLGSLENVALGIANGARYISAEQWLLVTLGLLGVAGAATLRHRQYRVLAVIATASPLLFFLAAWNKAIDVATGKPVNYWGSIVTPLLFALAPSALALLLPLASATRLTSPAALHAEVAGPATDPSR
jgi:hypothetical protein